MSAGLKGIALSLVASAAATYLLRMLLSVPSGEGEESRRNVIVIVPIIAGNTNKTIVPVADKHVARPWGRK
jgi:hypothetical protein